MRDEHETGATKHRLARPVAVLGIALAGLLVGGTTFAQMTASSDSADDSGEDATSTSTSTSTTTTVEETETSVEEPETTVEETETSIETAESTVEETETSVEEPESTEPAASVVPVDPSTPAVNVSASLTTEATTTTSVPSTPLAAVALAAEVAPSAPRSYRVIGVGNGRVSLAWSAPATGAADEWLPAQLRAGWRDLAQHQPRIANELDAHRTAQRHEVLRVPLRREQRRPIACRQSHGVVAERHAAELSGDWCR